MDEKLLSSILTGIVSVVIGVAGVYLGNYRAKCEYDSEVHKLQLSQAYGPIIRLLMENHGSISEQLVPQIDEIMCIQHALIAPSVLRKWIKYRDSKTRESEKQFISALLSNYNWVKKYLGYPYDEREITITDIPMHHWGQRQLIPAVLTALIVLVGCIYGYGKCDNQLLCVVFFVVGIIDFLLLMIWFSDLTTKVGRK